MNTTFHTVTEGSSSKIVEIVYKTTYHGKQWRAHRYHWNAGGVDGMVIRQDLEFLDVHSMWHDSESHKGETGRDVPSGIVEWSKSLENSRKGKL